MSKSIEFLTDQELDNSTNLYNYDARLYDPIMGRFISPDTFVQAPFNPQSLNRYSYCINNPLIYTDPSGNFWLWDWLFGDDEEPPPPPPQQPETPHVKEINEQEVLNEGGVTAGRISHKGDKKVGGGAVAFYAEPVTDSEGTSIGGFGRSGLLKTEFHQRTDPKIEEASNYAAGHKEVVSLVSGEGGAEASLSDLSAMVGLSVWAVKGTITGNHNLFNIVGIETELSGTILSAGAEAGGRADPKAGKYSFKLGIHWGVGGSFKLEFYRPKGLD